VILVVLAWLGAVVAGAAHLGRRSRRRHVVATRLAAPLPSARPARGAPIARALVAGCAGALLGGPVLAVLAVVSAASAGLVVKAVRAAGRGERYDAQVLEFLAGVGRALRSGASPHVALAEAATGTDGAAAADLDRLHQRLERGSSLADALRRWADERPRPAVRAAAAALALGQQTGGLRAEVVDGVAGGIRQRLEARVEARALATQARASAVVLAGAPLAFLVLGLGAGTGASEFLLRTPAGILCLVVGLALDAGAFVVMLRIVGGVGR